MRCPTCDAEMTRGRFGSHPERWHAQAFGPFGIPLLFTARGGEHRMLWCGARDGARGYACPSCSSVLLVEPHGPRGREDWVCPACGETVPGKFDTCWKCQQRRAGPRE